MESLCSLRSSRILLSLFIIFVSCTYADAQSSLDEREILSFIDAVQSDEIDLINDFIEAGVDLNIQVGNTTPLICAVERGNLDIVRLLVCAGADPNSLILMHNGTKKSATTAANLYPEILEFLIQSGANVNLKLSQRKTLLHLAAETYACNNDVPYNALCILLKNGASVNTIDLQGNTPLHLAAMGANWPCVFALIDSGGNLHMENDEGYSSLSYIYSVPNLGILKELVRRKIPLDVLAPHGRMYKFNVLHYVCMTTYDKKLKMDLIKYLIEDQKININQYSIDKTGTTLMGTPFMYALNVQSYYEEEYEILDYLIENGADINAPAMISNYIKPSYTHVGYKSTILWAIDIKLPQYIIEWMMMHGAKA